MCWDAAQNFPADPRSPAAARRFCTDELVAVLADQPERIGLLADVTLIVSELTTNAINAGATSALVRLTWHRHYLRLAVADDAPGTPQLHAASRDETSGRGLAITQSLSNAWGVEATQLNNHRSGKQVWAELSVPSILTDTLDCKR